MFKNCHSKYYKLYLIGHVYQKAITLGFVTSLYLMLLITIIIFVNSSTLELIIMLS